MLNKLYSFGISIASLDILLLFWLYNFGIPSKLLLSMKYYINDFSYYEPHSYRVEHPSLFDISGKE